MKSFIKTKRVRIFVLMLIFLSLALLNTELDSRQVVQAQQNDAEIEIRGHFAEDEQQTTYIDPLYGYELSLAGDWHIFPTSPDAVYGAASFRNYDQEKFEDTGLLPQDAVKIQIGVAPVWEGWSFEEWGLGWRANEIIHGEVATELESLQMDRFNGLSFSLSPRLDEHGESEHVFEILLDLGENRVMTMMFFTPSPDKLGNIAQVISRLDVSNMKTFPQEVETFTAPSLLDLLAEAASSSNSPESLLGSCPAGNFPGDNTPTAPFTLHMPFKSGQTWRVGGSGSFYGNGAHCNSIDDPAGVKGDHYATDWNRYEGNEEGEDVLPVANGTIDRAQWPTCVSGYGCYVVIDHASNIRTLYAHLSNVYRTSGAVNHWQRVGAVGKTGGSYSPHLHLSILQKSGNNFYSRCASASECAPGESPLSPQTIKPSPMYTQQGGSNTNLAGGSDYTSVNENGGCCGCLLAQPLVDAQSLSEYEVWLAAQVGVEGHVGKNNPLGLEGLLLVGEDVVMEDGVGGMDGVMVEEVDGKAPILGGSSQEIVWANEPQVPSFSWAAAEDESGVKGYYLYWGADEAGVSELMVEETGYRAEEEVRGDEAAVRYLRIAAEDEAGNVSDWQTVGLWHYDPVAPTGSLMVGSGGEIVRSLNVTLNLAAEDTEGAVTEMRFGVDGQKWTAWEPYQPRRLWQLENHEAQQVLYAQVRDEAGNVSQPLTTAVVAELNVEPPASDSYTLARSAVTMGGGEKTSPSYIVRGNSGQSHQTGELAGSSYRVISGFWAGINASASPGADEIMLQLSPVTVSTSISDTFEVDMIVQAGTAEVDGTSAYLNFNPAELRILSITPGSDFSLVLQNEFDNNTGEVNFAAGTLSEPYPSGTFTLATVTFEAIGESDGSSIDFNMTAPRQSAITFDGTSLLENTSGSTVMISNLTLNGCVTLPGRPSPPHARWVVPLRVSATVPGESEPAYTFEPTTDENGCFVLTGISPGTYEMRVKKSSSLQNLLREPVTLTAGTNDYDFEILREGDANDDNVVSILDFSILAGAFGKCAGEQDFDVRADFNGDDCITIHDFSLLASNFGQAGDILVPSEQSHQPTEAVTMLIEPALTRVKPGDPFSVRVKLQAGNQKVDGTQIKLRFDPELLQVEQLLAGEAFTLELANQVDNRNGSLTFAAGSLEAFPSGTIEVLELQLRALAATEGTELAFEATADSLYGSDVTVDGGSALGSVTSGTIMISEPTSIMLEELAAPATAIPLWLVVPLGLIVLGGICMMRRKEVA